jgi:hypothetical protein
LTCTIDKNAGTLGFALIARPNEPLLRRRARNSPATYHLWPGDAKRKFNLTRHLAGIFKVRPGPSEQHL